jgi:uncharacterized protein
MKRFLYLISLLLFTFSVFAQDIPQRPNPPRLVNDLADVLSDQEEQQLETELVQFNDQTSTQICIVTVLDLNGLEVSDFAFKLGETWGVGQKGKNNGIVIVFKPKTEGEKGKVFIAPGYGLEGVIPDAIANRIVSNEMIPRFRNGDTYGGIYAATQVLKGLAAGEFTAENYQNKKGGEKKEDSFGGIMLFVIILIVLVSIFKGGRGGGYSSRGSLPFWLAMGLLGSGNRGSGSFGGFSGGGGGGGFGGFGGGSFGGGGAGGSW